MESVPTQLPQEDNKKGRPTRVDPEKKVELAVLLVLPSLPALVQSIHEALAWGS